MISPRVSGVVRTRIRRQLAQDRQPVGDVLHRGHVDNFAQLFDDLFSTRSSPSTTKVILLMPGVSLWLTWRLSILKLRLRNMPDTRFSTPGFVAHPGDECVLHGLLCCYA